jgi:acyl carrier protein
MAGNHLNSKIRQFILEKFPLARKQELRDSDTLLESGILDSLGVLDLVSFLEQQYSITLNDDDLVPENFQTLERIVAFVERRTARND